ncbi:MAG: DUF4173 domain-containing protein [Clostridiales bacterium]|nr:DUF4173 domain-containing protein [Clostridiales bacterium]
MMKSATDHERRLGGTGLFLLGLALTVAFIGRFAHPSIFERSYIGLPGIGLTLTVYALMGGIVVSAARTGRLCIRKNPAGWVLLACSLLLSSCYGVFGNQVMRMMNGPVLALTCAQAIFSLTGYVEESALSVSGWRTGMGRLFPLLFRHIPLPFQAVTDGIRRRRGKMAGLSLGLAIALPVTGVAIVLLSSADGIFSDLFVGAFQSLENADGYVIIRIATALAGGLMLFSLAYGAVTEKAAMKERRVIHLPSLTFSVVLGALAAVYALFAYIQFRYLFSGSDAVQAQGGYAEYARSGFFQLVMVSCITLGILLPALALCKESRAVRILGGMVAALTVVIDVSAFFRMRLYIQAYGLTLLRVLTLWGMGAILVALVLTMVKCIRSKVSICPLLTAALLLSWIGMNYINVDVRIAEYNVAAWEEGRSEKLDVLYLANLSPDVLPVLERIDDESTRTQAVEEALAVLRCRQPLAYDWSLSWRHMPDTDAQTLENASTP